MSERIQLADGAMLICVNPACKQIFGWQRRGRFYDGLKWYLQASTFDCGKCGQRYTWRPGSWQPVDKLEAKLENNKNGHCKKSA